MERSTAKNIRVTTYRLSPRSESNARYLHSCISSCRYIWNSALDFANTAKIYTGLDSKEFLTDFKQEVHNDNLKKINSHILGKETQKLEVAFQQAFKKVRGFPRFKGKDKAHSFYVYNGNSKLVSKGKKGSKLFLQISGSKSEPSRDFLLLGKSNYPDGRYLGCTIVRHLDKFYAFVQYDIESKYIKRGSENGVVAAIDLNAKNVTILSSDAGFDVFKRPKEIDDTAEKREMIQSDKDEKTQEKTMTTGSRKFNEIKDEIKKLYKKEKDIRRTYCHNISRKIADSCQLVFVENLDLKKMAKSNTGTPENPNENARKETIMTREFICRAAPSQVIANLKYKMWQVIKVNPANTSRKCPRCGHISKDNRLSQEEFICVKCGFPNDDNLVTTHYVNADKVAAFNIYKRGLQLIKDLDKLTELSKGRLEEIAESLSAQRKQREKETDNAFKKRLQEAVKKALGKNFDELINLGRLQRPPAVSSLVAEKAVKNREEGGL